jgi:hypothetical protein
MAASTRLSLSTTPPGIQRSSEARQASIFPLMASCTPHAHGELAVQAKERQWPRLWSGLAYSCLVPPINLRLMAGGLQYFDSHTG